MSQAEVIGQLNEKECDHESETENPELKYKIFKSQINQIVSKALGKDGQSKSTESKKERNEKSEERSKSTDNNEMDAEMRFKLYKLKVHEIVSRALGNDKQTVKKDESDTYENENEIKTKSVDIKSKMIVNEDCHTIMKVESNEEFSYLDCINK